MTLLALLIIGQTGRSQTYADTIKNNETWTIKDSVPGMVFFIDSLGHPTWETGYRMVERMIYTSYNSYNAVFSTYITVVSGMIQNEHSFRLTYENIKLDDRKYSDFIPKSRWQNLGYYHSGFLSTGTITTTTTNMLK